MQVRVTIVLIIVLLLAYLPLMYAVNFKRNKNQIFPFKGSYVGSQGHVQQTDGHLVIGNLNCENDSQATWQFIIRVLPFMGVIMKNSAEAHLSIVGGYPLTSMQPYIQLTKVGWRDDDFREGWKDRKGKGLEEGTATVGERGLEVGREFTAGKRSCYLLRKQLPPINSSDYPYVTARWRSTSHVARLCAYDSEDNVYKVIVETESGAIQYPGTDYGGGYSPNWTTTFYKLPPNKTITWIDLGVDTGAWGDPNLGGKHSVAGVQHAYFDYIIFAQGQLEGSHITVKLNNNTIFDEKLTFSKGELHSLDFTKYMFPEFKFSFDSSLLETDNLVDVIVDSHTSWNVSSMSILLEIRKPDQPVWQTVPGHMPLLFLALSLEAAVVLVLLGKLRKWIETF